MLQRLGALSDLSATGDTKLSAQILAVKLDSLTRPGVSERRGRPAGRRLGNSLGYQEKGNIRPARPIVESIPAAIIDICACMPRTSVAITGNALILPFIP